MYPKLSPPSVFIGGPVPIQPGFPIQTFGNDGLLEAWDTDCNDWGVDLKIEAILYGSPPQRFHSGSPAAPG